MQTMVDEIKDFLPEEGEEAEESESLEDEEIE